MRSYLILKFYLRISEPQREKTILNVINRTVCFDVLLSCKLAETSAEIIIKHQLIIFISSKPIHQLVIELPFELPEHQTGVLLRRK